MKFVNAARGQWNKRLVMLNSDNLCSSRLNSRPRPTVGLLGNINLQVCILKSLDSHLHSPATNSLHNYYFTPNLSGRHSTVPFDLSGQLAHVVIAVSMYRLLVQPWQPWQPPPVVDSLSAVPPTHQQLDTDTRQPSTWRTFTINSSHLQGSLNKLRTDWSAWWHSRLWFRNHHGVKMSGGLCLGVWLTGPQGYTTAGPSAGQKIMTSLSTLASYSRQSI